MIEVERLSRVSGGKRILDDVSFRVPAGEITGFLGPNGAGKTTTLRILAGALAPTAGRVTIGGLDVTCRPDRARGRIGWLPERPPVAGDPTVGEYLAFVGRVRGLSGHSLAGAMEGSLAEVGLRGAEGQRMRSLSKGERIRAGLAAARLGDPEVLLLDEPTSGLDPRQLADVRGLIRRDRGRRTVLLSTHLLPEVTSTCDQVIVLHQGRIAATGTPTGLTDGPDRVRIVARGDAEPMRRALTEVAGVEGVDARSAGEGTLELSVQCGADADPRPELAAAIVSSGGALLELRRERPSLEEAFVRIVSTEGDET